MNATTLTRATPAPAVWTCPYCPLLCDRFNPQRAANGAVTLAGSDCPRALEGLNAALQGPVDLRPRIHGREADLSSAVDAAVQVLRQARQPLFGGLGTDVAGGRALHALARRTGAIADAGTGGPLMQVVQVLQDRGGYTTTLAEVAERADLIVFVGSWPLARAPELIRRMGVGAREPAPALWAWGAPEAPAQVEGLAGARVPVQALPLAGDLWDGAQQLAAHLAGRSVRDLDPGVATLAAQLNAARYVVFVWEPLALGPAAGLMIERLQQVIGLLNVQGRAAGFPVGGGDGAATVNQVFTWLGGLPTRSHRGPWGLEHEPRHFDAQRLIDDAAVDALLWVSSWRAAPVPALPGRPRIVLGLPAQAAALGDEAHTIFLPVATPGVHHEGHVFRTDGVVMLPLHQLQASPWPSVAQVVTQMDAALAATEGAPA